MERPGHADDGVKQSAIRLQVVNETEQAKKGDGKDAVERKKIWGERDPKICPIGDDMTAVTAYAKMTDPAAHEPDPNRVCQFVPENINENRTWQSKEGNQP